MWASHLPGGEFVEGDFACWQIHQCSAHVDNQAKSFRSHIFSRGILYYCVIKNLVMEQHQAIDWSIGQLSQILTGQNVSFTGQYVTLNPESLF